MVFVFFFLLGQISRNGDACQILQKKIVQSSEITGLIAMSTTIGAKLLNEAPQK